MTSPLDRIADLAAWLAAAGLDELELTGPQGRVYLRRAPGGADAVTGDDLHGKTSPDQGGADEARETVASPGVGHYLGAHLLRAEPLVRPDDAVAAGQTIGLLRVGALLIPVPAPRDGIVARVIAEEGGLVGYGAPLVELRSEG